MDDKDLVSLSLVLDLNGSEDRSGFLMKSFLRGLEV